MTPEIVLHKTVHAASRRIRLLMVYKWASRALCVGAAGCLVWLLTKAWNEGKPGRNYWWVAPVYPQAKIAYRRLRFWLFRASKQAGFQFYTSNESELTIGSAARTL